LEDVDIIVRKTITTTPHQTSLDHFLNYFYIAKPEVKVAMQRHVDNEPVSIPVG